MSQTFEKSEPMKCSKCPTILQPGDYVVEVTRTVGWVNEGAPHFEKDYFEPSECTETEYLCEKCVNRDRVYYCNDEQSDGTYCDGQLEKLDEADRHGSHRCLKCGSYHTIEEE